MIMGKENEVHWWQLLKGNGRVCASCAGYL